MALPDIDPESFTGNKVVRTFRMPRDLVDLLGREAHPRNLDLTALVLRILHGYLSHSALPEAAAAQLEEDRKTLGMDRSQYLAHVLYHRCLQLRELGPGFDDPHAPGPAGQAEPAPLGTAGGGTHSAARGLVPGAGVWPFGVRTSQKPKA
jgi:hypothetical protein